jgi:hypothetical protein
LENIILIGFHKLVPHSLSLFINNIDVKTFGSQGQQRSTALSLKLSELEFIRSECSEYPVLLLDDVLSELDIKRQRYLLENLKNIQTIITCTSINEIMEFSRNINMQELKDYRIAVGRKTREIIGKLEYHDMKRKFEKHSLERILDEGAVVDTEGAKWLIDFWGRKNVAGIILMPGTRHQVVHINEALTAKKKALLKKNV